MSSRPRADQPDVRRLGYGVRYQIVVQIPEDGADTLDMLVALEDKLMASVGDVAEVDGHDLGSGEANVFLLTSNPRAAFREMLPILESAGMLNRVRVAFRDLHGETYTVLWPERLSAAFSVA